MLKSKPNLLFHPNALGLTDILVSVESYNGLALKGRNRSFSGRCMLKSKPNLLFHSNALGLSDILLSVESYNGLALKGRNGMFLH